jgi:benzoate 4-monooxygenase
LFALYVCFSGLKYFNHIQRLSDKFKSPGYNYLAFDVIGDLAFGSPFGMIQAAKDSAPVAKSQDKAIAAYGSEKADAIDVEHIPAIQILNNRGEYSASMGVLPVWCRPLLKHLHPWYRKGNKAVQNLAGIAVAAVSKRLSTPTDRVDLLSKLQEGKDDEGRPMGRQELTAEALTQLIAGSDTTSKYGICMHPLFIRLKIHLVHPVLSLTISLTIQAFKSSFRRN